MAAEAAHGEHEHGAMSVTEHQATFNGFLVATVWGCTLVAQYVMLFTLCFAMGLGWWPGLLAFTVIGAVSGFVFKSGGAWWAVLIASVLLLGIGGIIVPMIAGLVH